MNYYESFIPIMLLKFYFKTNELVSCNTINSSDINYLPM